MPPSTHLRNLVPRSVNAHIHLPPNFSAFESVEQAVRLAAEQGLSALGASNYYDYSVYAEFSRRAAAAGIFPLFGLEVIALDDELMQAGVKVNDPGNPGKMYLCGKGLGTAAALSAKARSLLDEIRGKDSERMAAVVSRLEQLCADAGEPLGLTVAKIRTKIVQRYGCPAATVYLQERHVAEAFQQALFETVPAERRGAVLARLLGAPSSAPGCPPTVQNELRARLMKAGRPGYVAETFVGFDHAYRLVLALGGIPCYPVLADGASPICAFEETAAGLIDRLQDRRIYAAEFIPNRNAPELLMEYVPAIRAAGIIVTAGTEHNTPEMLPLVPACRGGGPIPDPARAIFWEGACVVAAHQHLTAAGGAGYVDSTGDLTPGYADAETRIQRLAAIGAELITADP